LGLITQSINSALTDNYNTYTNPNNPYAELQDTNYRLNSFTVPRYYGSKTISATYNDYTVGDESYGSTAAIDKIKFQYAYLVDMYSSSLQLPGRVNAQIKYIFTNDQNVLNLTKANENIFTTQNVFKSGETVDISLFDYDPSDQNIQFLTNNKNLTLFEGGFRYSPVLYNVAGNNNPAMTYIFKTPFEGTNTATNPATNIYTAPNSSNALNTFVASFGNFYNGVQNAYTASINKSGGGTLSENLRFGLSRTVNSQGVLNGLVDIAYYAEFNSGTSLPIQISNFPYGILPGSSTFYNDPTLFDISAFSLGQATQINTPVFLNSVNESDHRWYAVDGRTVRLTATQSQYYSSFTYGPTASVAGFETPVFPFILENGDMVRFYNVSASNFGREDEFRVVSTYQESSASISYYYVTLDRNLSRNNVDSGSFPSFISRYIALKKIPDETNLILNYSSSGNIPQDGLVFPQYINPLVKRNSGNLVKALKQQNLI